MQEPGIFYWITISKVIIIIFVFFYLDREYRGILRRNILKFRNYVGLWDTLYKIFVCGTHCIKCNFIYTAQSNS